MGLSYTEVWDADCTPPALPSGWNVNNAAVVTQSTGSYSSPNSLTLSGAGATHNLATYGTDDGSGSSPVTILLTGICRHAYTLSATQAVGIAFRGNNATLNDTSTSCYVAVLDRTTAPSNSFILGKLISGTLTPISTLPLYGTWSNAWYQIRLAMTADGTSSNSIQLQVVRLGDGFYLNSSGVFAAGAANAITSTDNAILTGGYSGIFMTSAGANRVGHDDWSLTSSATAAVNPPKPFIGRWPAQYYLSSY